MTALVQIMLGWSSGRARQLRAALRPVPPEIQAKALIGIGAESTCIDISLIQLCGENIMKRLVALLVGVTMSLALTSGLDAQRANKPLEGTWRVTSSEFNGEKLPADPMNPLSLIFKGDALTMRGKPGPENEITCRFSIDQAKKPCRIDLKAMTGDNKGETLLGIYELKGRILRICFGKKRPTEFSTERKTGALLLVLNGK